VTKMMLAAILLVGLSPVAQAQIHHDPLTAREVDEMRDSAQDPKKRVEYLIDFARERVLAIDRLRTTTRPGLDDAGKMEQLLTDLAELIDELDDNLDMYNRHSEDLRRPLRQVIGAEAEFQQKLKALDDTATPLQKRRFAAALEDASDSLESSTDSARAMLADQIAKKGEEKKNDKADRQEVQAWQRKHAPDAGDKQPPGDTGMGGTGVPSAEHGEPRFW